MYLSNYPIVTPVMEFGFRAFQLSQSEQRLELLISENATRYHYITTPDGWFVPLSDLEPYIGIVVEFLRHEMIHYGEFEIGGGFTILASPNLSLTIPLDSTFRFAMDLANAVIEIKPGENQKIAVGNQEIWAITADWVAGEIQILKGNKGNSVIKMPLEPLRMQFRAAQSHVIKFVTELEKHLKDYKDLPLSSSDIKFIFGLEKIIDSNQ